MLEAVLEKILQKLFGDYIANLDQENLHVGVWSGNVRLENVYLKKSILNQLKLPFVVKFGKIRLLSIVVPWRKIASNPVEVLLDGLYVTLTPQAQSEWKAIDTISPQVKEEALQAFTQDALQKLEQKVKEGMSSDGKMSFWERIMVKIIDNIQITIKDVHIRFEDHMFCKTPYAFGFTLNELLVMTTNEKWVPEYIDRTEEANRDRPLHKHLKLAGFSFYWESEGAFMVSALGTDAEVEGSMKKIAGNIAKRNYILKPLHLEVKFVQSGKSNDYSKPRYSTKFAIDNLTFKMHKVQFDNIVEISKVIEQYQKLQFSFEDKKKYKNFRPLYALSATKAVGVLKEKYKNENAVLWWKYSIECIKRVIREKHGKEGQFRISDAKLKLYKQDFMLLYAKIVNSSKELSGLERQRYNKILYIFEERQLKLWATKVLQQVEKKTVERQAEEQAKKANSGWMSYLFGSNKSEEDKKQISEEELQKICSVLHVEEETEVESTARTDEYYWLVGEFSLGKGVVKIQRDTKKGESQRFKEAIVLSLEGIQSRFQKRFKGLDLDARVGTVVLSTYSSFGKGNRINNVVVTRNTVTKVKETTEEKDLAFVKMRVMPPNTDMQLEVEARAKSLRIYYLPLLMSRMMMFLGQGEIRSSTYNALNEIKDNTQGSIQAALEGKKSRILVAIESPVLIVPILKNNDPSSPVWCFKLGDICVNTKPDTQLMPEGPIYDHFELNLENIGLDFYETLLAYEAYEKTQEVKQQDHFVLIDDFSVLVDIGVLKGTKKRPEVASTKIDCGIKSLKFRFTPLLYNFFVNISDAFSPSEDDVAWREVARDKASIVQAQRMLGIVKKRGEGLKKYWYRYYCCLSGGYLYFYEANRQLYPTSYFYLKNTEVLDGRTEIGIENTLVLKSKAEQCYLAFNTEKDSKNWKREIEAVIKEISLLSETVYKKSDKPINYEAVINETRISIARLEVELLDEKDEPLLKGQILDAESVAVKRAADFLLTTKVRSLELFHPKNRHFQKIVYNEEGGDLLSFSVEILTKNSPKFKQELLIVDVQLGHLIGYYPTKLIKKLMQILLDIKPKERPKAKEEEKKGEVLNKLLSVDEKEEQMQKVDTCEENKDIVFRMNIRLDNVQLNCLHPKYDTLFARFSMETSFFTYASYSDHDAFHCDIGSSTIEDLTNYPNTILPLDIFDEKVKPQLIMQIVSSGDNEYPFTVDMTSYQSYCPKRPLIPDNLYSKIQIQIGTIKIYYYNEYVSMRLMDYMLYQLLDSLSPRDSVAESLAMYEKNKKPHEGQDLYDVIYFGTFSSFDLVISQPLIYLKPRLHYKDFFLLNLGNLHMWNERQKIPGRWLKHRDKEFLCETYHIETSSLTIKFNDKQSVLEPCHFVIACETACVEAHDYNNHDPKVLDLSLHLKVNSLNIIKMCMKPEQYTYLLKCLDLNVNYTDNSSDLFNFKSVKVDVIEGGVNYMVSCNLPVISFLTLNYDNTTLAEFVAKDNEIIWIANTDYSKAISVGTSHFYSLHEPNSDGRYKSIIIAPLISDNQVRTDNSFYSSEQEKSVRIQTRTSVMPESMKKMVRISLQMMKNSEKVWNVVINKHKMFLELHFLMLLSHFFIEGFPDYKNCPEQPNEYSGDPEKNPKSTYNLNLCDMTMMLPSEDPSTCLALRGELSIEFMMECIASVKEELAKGAEQSPSSSPAQDASAGGPDSTVTYSFVVEVQNMCPFMCDARELNGQSLKFASKRKIVEPASFKFVTKDYMQYDKVNKLYKTFGDTELQGSQIFISISYQDIMYLCSAFVYNMKALEREYFAKLIQFNKLKSRHLEFSEIEELKDESGIMLMSPKVRPSASQGLEESASEGLVLDDKLERVVSEYVPFKPAGEENIMNVLSEAMKAMEQLKKASAAVSNYKAKASSYAGKSSKAGSQLKSSASRNSSARRSVLVEETKLSKFLSDEIAGSASKASAEKESISVAIYERLHDTTTIKFDSVKMLLINDYKSVFSPILNINMLHPKYKGKNKLGAFSVKLSSMYYNPIASFWEPFIEKTKLNVEMDDYSLKLRCDYGFDINISDTLISVLAMTWKSWNEKKSPASSRRQTQRQSGRISARQRLGMEKFEHDEQGVCPFSVLNETGMTIYLSKQAGAEGGIESFDIMNANTLDVMVNYEDTIENIIRNSNNNVKLTDNIFKISFDPSTNYPPITNINFNTVGSGIHYLGPERDDYNYLVYSVTLDHTLKLVTIRTPIVLINKTEFKFCLTFIPPPSSPDQNVRDCTFDQGSVFALPIDYMDWSFVMSFGEDRAKSAPQSALNIISILKSKPTWEVQIGEKSVVLIKEKASTENSYDIAVVPPYSFRNALPYCMRFRKQGDHGNIMLDVGQEKSFYNASSELPVSLEVTIPGYVSAVFRFNPAEQRNEHKLRINDHRNLPFKAYIRVIKNKTARYSFYIYARACILNNTECKMSYYYASAIGSQPIAGQSVTNPNILMISNRPTIRVALDSRFMSRQLSVRATGVADYFEIMKPEENRLRKIYEFVMTTMLSLAVQDEYIYTKIITLAPKYVFRNLSDEPLQIAQEGCFEQSLLLPPGESRPFHWPNHQRQKMVMLRLSTSSSEILDREFSEWHWSSMFSLEELGTTTVKCKHQKREGNFMVIKIRKAQVNGSIAIGVEREREEHPAYRIENYSRHFSMSYWQKDVGTDKDYLDTLSQVTFGWTDNNRPRILQVKFFLGSLTERPIELNERRIHEFKLDELDQRREIRIRLTNKTGHMLYVSTLTDGHTKILKITDVQSAFDMTSKDEKVTYNYFLSLRKLGVSIVIKHGKQRSELTYVSFDDIKLLAQTFETQLKLQLKVGELQLDNQLAFRVPYPVILQSTALKKQQDSYARHLSFFDIAIVMRTQVQYVYYFELIDCLIQTMDVKLDDEVLSFVIDFADHVMKELQTTVSSIHEIFLGNEQDNPEFLSYGPENNPVKTSKKLSSPSARTSARKPLDETPESKIYIAKLRLSPIEIVLSFLKKMQSEGKLLSQAGIISKAVGVALTNVEATTINLNALQLEHVFGSTSDVFSKIYGYYSEHFIRTAFKIIGSIDFIGNPVKFFHTIATGVKDFFYKPIQGFVQGPLQGSTGVYEGTKSLIKNTIIGIFGSISKITSSWSKGLLALSNDDQYMSKREERFIKERAETIVDGIGYGLMGAFKSIFSGVFGIFRQPFEGARKRGIRGFLKGTFFAIMGVAVKPVCGVLDFVARTSEGGKNTATIFEQNVEVRCRNPRPFYTKFQIIRKYVKQDADIRTFLENVKKGKYLKEDMLDESVFQSDDDLYLLFMTERHIVYISIKEKFVIWQIRTSRLTHVTKSQNGLSLSVADCPDVVMLVPDPEDIDIIYEKLNEILELRSYLTYQQPKRI